MHSLHKLGDIALGRFNLSTFERADCNQGHEGVGHTMASTIAEHEHCTISPTIAPIHVANNRVARSRARDGVVHLVIPGSEVKNGEPLEFELQRQTIELFDLKLSAYHPRLTDTARSWLFPGAGDGPKERELLGDQITSHVFKATGLHVNLHLFRHIAAKVYLDRNPGGYEVVRRHLGHRSMDTTTRFYAGMETAAASRHFDEGILKLRSALTDEAA